MPGIYVPAIGSIGAKIVLCGEAPGTEEEAALEPFVGPSGRLLNQLLADVGIKRAECWITNVSKYFVSPNTPPKKVLFSTRAQQAGIDINKCIDELRIELSQLNPNVVVALGASALWA